MRTDRETQALRTVRTGPESQPVRPEDMALFQDSAYKTLSLWALFQKFLELCVIPLTGVEFHNLQ